MGTLQVQTGQEITETGKEGTETRFNQADNPNPAMW